MKYYIISGEASGDLHTSKLLKKIKSLDANACFRGWGGDLMQNEGMELVKHYKEHAFMGFIEILFSLRTILSHLKFCKKDILQFNPDALILVDYPGFNLRIAKWAKKQNIKIFYYISPQIWAWKENRINTIKRCVEKMFVILPFEKDFFAKHNFKVDFVGHPLLEEIEKQSIKFTSFEEFTSKNKLYKKPIIAILPGSRKLEIIKSLPIMISIIPEFKDYQFVIAGTNSISQDIYNDIIKQTSVKIIYNQTYSLLKNSTAAIVTSGTATLETALFEVPEVVCYKNNKISYWIVRFLIKVKYISLVNLIMNEEVVKELIQNNLNQKKISQELKNILPNGKYFKDIKNKLSQLKEKLGNIKTSETVANIIYDNLNKKQ